MKFFLTTTLVLCSLLFALTPNALQASATADLDEVIDYANQAKGNAVTAKEAAADLATLYFQLNDDNIGGYIVIIHQQMNQLESATDEINYFIQSAASQNPLIDPTNIATWAGSMEGLEDDVQQEADHLETLIQNGQRSAARSSYRLLRSYLKQQIDLANQIKAEAESLKSLSRTYDVRIELIYNGQVYNGSTTLGGFYGFNQDLQEYFYPDQNADNELTNLPAGTYTFGSYQGYFDGTNHVDVTLDPSLEGPDGFIVVQLNYWSE